MVTNNRALAPRDSSETEPYEAFDHADDTQILAELRGHNTEVMQKLVYRFNNKGTMVTGLSRAGVLETVREMNARGVSRVMISPTPPIITETNEYFEVKAYAVALDPHSGGDRQIGGHWGIKRQAKQGNVFAL